MRNSDGLYPYYLTPNISGSSSVLVSVDTSFMISSPGAPSNVELELFFFSSKAIHLCLPSSYICQFL